MKPYTSERIKSLERIQRSEMRHILLVAFAFLCSVIAAVVFYHLPWPMAFIIVVLSAATTYLMGRFVVTTTCLSVITKLRKEFE